MIRIKRLTRRDHRGALVWSGWIDIELYHDGCIGYASAYIPTPAADFDCWYYIVKTAIRKCEAQVARQGKPHYKWNWMINKPERVLR